jgi:hypothetical protein
MGCDIHAFVEVKIGKKWFVYNHPDIVRDYDLFSKMAGVRGQAKPISLLRGLPKDLSMIAQIANEHWGSDGHSHSWLTLKELGIVEDWYEKIAFENNYKTLFAPFGYLFGNKFHKDSISKIPEIQDVRMVFWFDS